MSDPRYGADLSKGRILEGGGMAGIIAAFWPAELGGSPRVPTTPGICACGGYTQQSYGGIRICLTCAIERRAAERPQ